MLYYLQLVVILLTIVTPTVHGDGENVIIVEHNYPDCRIYNCSYQVKNGSCGQPGTYGTNSTSGTEDTHLKFHNCTCEEAGNWTSQDNQTAAANQTTLQLDSSAHECFNSKIVLNYCSHLNTTFYLIDRSNTSSNSMPNSTKNFQCLKNESTNCLSYNADELMQKNCTSTSYSVSTPPALNSAATTSTTSPCKTSNNSFNNSSAANISTAPTSENCSDAINVTSSTNDSTVSTTNSSDSTSPSVTESTTTPEVAAAAQSDAYEQRGMIVVCVIVGLSILVGAAVCTFMICQRRRLTLSYKGQQKALQEQIKADKEKADKFKHETRVKEIA
jgi:hypothetical protein